MPEAENTPHYDAVQAIEQHRDRLTTEVNEDVLHLRGAINALGARVESRGIEEDGWPPNLRETLEWANERGPGRVYEHMTISLCAGLEVYIEDVFLSVCQAVPPTHDKFRTVKLPITDLMTLTEAERYRALWNDLDVKGPLVDRSDKIFGLLDINIGIAPLAPELQALYPNKLDNTSTRALLREMQAVRNALLHRRESDTRLATLAPERYPLGEPIGITDEAVSGYGVAVHTYAGALGLAALHYLYDQEPRSAGDTPPAQGDPDYG